MVERSVYRHLIFTLKWWQMENEMKYLSSIWKIAEKILLLFRASEWLFAVSTAVNSVLFLSFRSLSCLRYWRLWLGKAFDHQETEINMCREGIRWGDHIWHLCRRTWEVKLLFPKEISNNFLSWKGIFFHCIFKQHFDAVSHRQGNFNAHHTVYQLSVKLLP